MITGDVAEKLEQIAVEIRETFEERGHGVQTALDQDRAFKRSGNSRSSLTRDLVGDAFLTGASRVGFDVDLFAKGGAKQFRAPTGSGIGLFRLKKAEQNTDGKYRILANGSALWGDADDYSLLIETPYVLGFTMSSNQIHDIFYAKVIGVTIGNPGELRLSGTTVLNGRSPVGGGSFEPEVDDALPGFEDEQPDTDSGVA